MKKLLIIFVLLPLICRAQTRQMPLPVGSGSASFHTCSVCAKWDATYQSAGVTLSPTGYDSIAAVAPGSGKSGIATIGKSSGKWYWEITWNAGTYLFVGIAKQTTSLTTYVGATNDGWSYYAYSLSSSGTLYHGSVTITYGSSWTAGDVIGVALDMDNGAVYFRKNGTWQNGGVPTSGSSKTGAAYSLTLPMTVYPAWGLADSEPGKKSCVANFGYRQFRNNPPAGYNYGIY